MGYSLHLGICGNLGHPKPDVNLFFGPGKHTGSLYPLTSHKSV
jgi:hypothetical protein